MSPWLYGRKTLCMLDMIMISASLIIICEVPSQMDDVVQMKGF